MEASKVHRLSRTYGWDTRLIIELKFCFFLNKAKTKGEDGEAQEENKQYLLRAMESRLLFRH